MRAFNLLTTYVLTTVIFSSTSAHNPHSHPLRKLGPTKSMTMVSSMSMSMSSSTSTSYKCPVCGMSSTTMEYNNENHVGFEHGQTVYTCGMAARSSDAYDFDVTDTSYLAANVAEFILNATDASAYAECKDSCDQCADGIMDPVTGDDVTTNNYRYVCLNNGQKIYFASTASKNKYLENVNSEPRYLVDSIICGGKTCSDATKITALSAAAKAFVPDLSSSSSSGSSNSAPVNSLTSLTFAALIAAMAMA